MPRLRPTRRVAALALALMAVAGLSAASASQLAVDGGTLQSGVGLLVDCQPPGVPIEVRLASTYAAGEYRTTGITFSGVDPACDGLSFRAQLVSTTGAVIDTNGAASGADATGTVSLSGGSFSVAPTGLSVATASIGTVALVLTD